MALTVVLFGLAVLFAADGADRLWAVPLVLGGVLAIVAWWLWWAARAKRTECRPDGTWPPHWPVPSAYLWCSSGSCG